MMIANIGFWKNILKILTVIATVGGAWAALSTIWEKLKRYRKRCRWLEKERGWLLPLIPNSRRAWNLKRLVKSLGQAQKWFSSSESPISQSIRHKLSKVAWNVWTEALSYVALYSKKRKQQRLALRNLSQTENEEIATHVSNVIKGVLDNPFTSKSVKKVAEAALKELEERQQMQ